jgi:arylsulfatase A-like enzyme
MTPGARSLTSLLVLALSLGAACGGESSEPPAGGAASTESPSKPPLHVLLIVVDTLRADHLSCYGYWRDTSPHIDYVAKHGVKFTRAIAQSSWTAPSMIAMMTGQRLSEGRFDIVEDKPTLAELFKDAGFKTGAWVANELLNHEMGFARGFEAWTDEKTWHSTRPPGALDGILAWLDANRSNDTFTWVHFTDPHDPYLPPENLRSSTPGRLDEHRRQLLEEAAQAEDSLASLEADAAEVALQIGLYDDEILAVDQKIGTLLRRLGRNGNLENAIVMITADHGECLWQRKDSALRLAARRAKHPETPLVRDRLKMTHGDLVYQELVRVPLVVMAPGLPQGVLEQAVIEGVHLAPTLLALAGIECAEVDQMAGRNIFGQELLPGAYTMTVLGEAFLAEDGWKLILPTEKGMQDHDQPLQLYDLNADPGELRNLAGEFPERVAELTRRIEERRATALPRQTEEERLEKIRASQKALENLGYVGGGGHVDLGDEHEHEHGGGDE